MDTLTSFANSIYALGDILLRFYNSEFFAFIKFLIGIYTVILFVNVVTLLMQRGVSGDYRTTKLGMDIPPELVDKKKKDLFRANWDKRVRNRLRSEKDSDYKLAIMEADYIVDDLLKRMGYKGENMAERLAGIPAGQIEDADNLAKAHEIRNRIINQDKFTLTQEEAKEVVDLYESFLKTYLVLN